jgi:MoxR-like ATPase
MCAAIMIDRYKADTLASGPPGVGKTMTAEGLSEHLKRPLYTVSTSIQSGAICADLGRSLLEI